ncbi:MAG: DUF1329 domain-containing protein, partial [Deltaproteobacteria bacterium]
MPACGRFSKVFLSVPLAVCFVVVPVAVRADVVPGDVISKANMEKAADYLHPGLSWCLERGLVMDIVPYRGATYPPVFREATEQYQAQVRISDDARRLENYVAGQPFPHLDP